MWTTAYKRILQGRAQRHNAGSVGSMENFRAMNNAVYTLNLGNPQRNTVDALTNSNSYITSYVRTSATNPSAIIFGSGNTPASADDYTLDNLLTSITAISSNGGAYVRNADGDYETTLEKVCVNSGSSPITIAEWGIVVWPQDNASTTYKVPVLAYREVLPTPVVVGAGKVFRFSANVVIPNVEG